MLTKAQWENASKEYNAKWIKSIKENEYYKRDNTLEDLIRGKDVDSVDLKLTKEILEYISSNNELTILGTLNIRRFQSIFKPTYYHEVCKEKPDMIFDFKNF